MSLLSDPVASRALLDRFRAGSRVFELPDPPKWGIDDTTAATVAELASLLLAVEEAGRRFRLVVLGAAPGEWALRAERAWAMVHPEGEGDFRTINLEGDAGHVALTRDFLARNGADPDRNEVRHQVIGDRDGFAYFPIINPGVDWGAGLAAIGEQIEELGDKVSMTDIARTDRIAANEGRPLEFSTVPAISLETLLDGTGTIDLLFSDIQGAEGAVFPTGMAAIDKAVRRACVGTHGKDIEARLQLAFADHGWIAEAAHPCRSTGDGDDERVTTDGVFIWRNPRLAAA